MSATTELTPAIVLGAMRYGETSRIVKLLTRSGGLCAAIAKGASRPRSPFGASLQLLSEGVAHLRPARGELQPLIAFDVTDLHAGLASHLGRFHAANAMAELVVRFVPSQPNSELYDEVVDAIALLELAPPDALPVVSLRGLWRLVREFGLAPVLDECARDGAALAEGEIGFSFRDGGLLCPGCARGGVATRLAAEDCVALRELLSPDADLPVLDNRHVRAHARLLVRWVAIHLGDARLPALEAWQEGVGEG
ncbi:MAG: DNA repair protein RecO [Gemmatimonadales bacterium]|nr:DNA repair protein RecO [Gemmatimonadales bacterium]